MRISVREASGVYFLSGELDWAGAEDFLVVLKRHPAEAIDEVVLNLADVSFIDSIGVRALGSLRPGHAGWHRPAVSAGRFDA
jgi:anti-anti-sigma factor